jgi:hypothetical protein
MSRFLLAAACLSIAPLAHAINWIPTSPLVQIGDDLDIFFDGSLAFEVTDNLYSAAIAKSATSWTVTPGLVLEYGKETPIAFTFGAHRSYVYFNKSEYSDLEDSRDSLSANLRIAPGGPLTVTIESSYRVTARNDDLAAQGVSGDILGATLLRQSNYSHSIDAEYKLTEKLRMNLGFANTYNHYLNPVVQGPFGSQYYNTNSLTELNTKSIPLSFDYQTFEKLSFGFKYQHDITDYSAAPYYSQGLIPRPALVDNSLTKDFFGLTAKGQLTESGKLNIIGRAGYSHYRGDNTGGGSAPSYSISLSHALTELINHTLSFSRDVNASSTGGQSDSRTYTYSVVYTVATDLNVNFSVTKSDVVSGPTEVNTWLYALGAEYKYNPHLSFQAGYNFTDSKLPSNSAANFQSNTFTLSTAFRY